MLSNLVCVQQFCVRCEDVEGDVDCLRCGMRRHWFWYETVEDLLTYLCEPRPWDNKIVPIANNAKAYDFQFILNRAILVKW